MQSRFVKYPVYARIEADIRSRITHSEWSVESLLPIRQKLAQEYGTTLPTTERAVKALLDEGVLRATKRQGTYVARKPDLTNMLLPTDSSALAKKRVDENSLDHASLLARIQPTSRQVRLNNPSCDLVSDFLRMPENLKATELLPVLSRLIALPVKNADRSQLGLLNILGTK